MEFPLSKQNVRDLFDIQHCTLDKKVADKLKCIELINRGYDLSHIVNLLEIDEKTIRKWSSDFLACSNIEEFVTRNIFPRYIQLPLFPLDK
ncbi:MAG: helix-turn-helix domain-containing protein [Bacteroidota bacterium]